MENMFEMIFLLLIPMENIMYSTRKNGVVLPCQPYVGFLEADVEFIVG